MSFFVAALLDKVGDKPMVSPKNLVGPEEILRVDYLLLHIICFQVLCQSNEGHCESVLQVPSSVFCESVCICSENVTY